MATLSDRIRSYRDKYNNHDPAWVHYVQDHRSILLASCTARIVVASEQIMYRYRLMDYLRSIHYDHTATWIVLYLNQLESERDFNNIDSILLPDLRTLATTYAQYKTYAANLEVSTAKLTE